MAKHPDITATLCRQLLRYEAENGCLYWLPRSAEMFRDVIVNGGRRSAQAAADAFNVRFAGREAFTASKDGYRVGMVAGRMLRAHRVVWAIVYGEWPEQHIDHINGDRSDNRIGNLRDVSNLENHRNEGRSKNNRSGVNGVVWCKQTGKWRAMIRVNYKTRCLGRFADIGDAIAARRQADADHGFSLRHGK